MTNPYDILGVLPSASDDEIKNSYREKARKISMESYNDENTADYERKMNELDRAYDAIMAQRRPSGFAQSGSSANSSDYSRQYSSYPSYSAIRDEIRNGKLDSAQAMLSSIPEMSRTAEWYYLEGMVQQQKGWTNAAFENYSKAYKIDPSNPEYEHAYQAMNANRTGGYRTQSTGRSSSSCGFCDICQGLICADCCCECMGGDLISCC